MFYLKRDLQGKNETLKDSSSQLDKTFKHIADATNLAKKLNRNIRKEFHWKVHETND